MRPISPEQLNALAAQRDDGGWDTFENPDIEALQSLAPELLDHSFKDGRDYYRITRRGSAVLAAHRPA